jgi:glycerophosphoryl diester phosphodiesterase
MRRTLTFVLAMLLNVAPATAAGPLIVAHRGASYDAPENTHASFKLGLDQGADALETDFWLTADGHVVCMHDKDTKRTTGGATVRLVSEATLAELQSLDVGSWKSPKFATERPPTLLSALSLLPDGKLFLLEIKCGPEIVPQFKRDLEASGKPLSQLRIISFNADVVAAVKQQIPGIKAYWLTSYKKDEATGRKLPTHDEVLATLKRINADGLDTKADLDVLTPEFVKRLRDGGYEFHAWTVDDPAVAKKLVDLGVDSITTNRPGWLREQLAK